MYEEFVRMFNGLKKEDFTRDRENALVRYKKKQFIGLMDRKITEFGVVDGSLV